MRTDAAWSLTELLVVVAIVALLAAILVPAVGHVREMARLAVCAAGMHDLHMGIITHGNAHDRQLPPFAFSDISSPSLPLSGHWGGASQAGDPAAFGRRGVECVNLWVLVRDGYVPPAELICPAVAAQVAAGKAGYFPHTFRYSTYCLRMPTSADLFRRAPATWEQHHMGIYRLAAGGQPSPVKVPDPFGAASWETVPLVKLDRRYTLLDNVACGDGEYDVLTDVLLADAFWRRGCSAEAPQIPGLQGYRVDAAWCHGERFNVLVGGGAVRAVTDDGTVRANTIAPGGALADDGAHFATYAERVWQFFDRAR